jgi:hypothetical protein
MVVYYHIVKMGMAGWQSGIADGSISTEREHTTNYSHALTGVESGL